MRDLEGTRPGGRAGAEREAVPAPGFGSRLTAVVDRVGTRREAARRAGVSLSSLQRYLAEQVTPPFPPVARLCHAGGMSLDWLSTGTGARHRPDPEAGIEPVDWGLLSEVVAEMMAALAPHLYPGEARRSLRALRLLYGLKERAPGEPLPAHIIRATLSLPDLG